MSQNKLGLQKTSELVGRKLETPKRHLWIKPVPKRTCRLQASHQMSKGAFGTPDDKEKAAFGAFYRQLNDRRSWTTTVAQTKTKMDLVGSGCEKTKHHLNPSPKRPKTLRNQKQKTGETLPTEPSKDKKKIASSTTKLQAAGNMSQNKLGLQKTSELVETPKRHLWITL